MTRRPISKGCSRFSRTRRGLEAVAANARSPELARGCAQRKLPRQSDPCGRRCPAHSAQGEVTRALTRPPLVVRSCRLRASCIRHHRPRKEVLRVRASSRPDLPRPPSVSVVHGPLITGSAGIRLAGTRGHTVLLRTTFHPASSMRLSYAPTRANGNSDPIGPALYRLREGVERPRDDAASRDLPVSKSSKTYPGKSAAPSNGRAIAGRCAAATLKPTMRGLCSV